MGDHVQMGVAAPVDEVMHEAPVKEAFAVAQGNANGHVADAVEGQPLEEAVAPVEDREGIFSFVVCLVPFCFSSFEFLIEFFVFILFLFSV